MQRLPKPKRFPQIVLLGFVLLASARAYADSGLSLVFLSSKFNSGAYYFYYQLQLAVGATIQPGDFVTFYDVDSLITIQAPTGFTPGMPYLGATPSSLAGIVVDNASISNFDMTYTDSSTITGPYTSGNILLISTNGTPNFNAEYAASFDGNLSAVIGSTVFPSETSNPVPEPATSAMLAGCGALMAGFLFRRRWRVSSQSTALIS